LHTNARPKLTGHVENMADYAVIFLGYPDWWGTIAHWQCGPFLEEYDFSGKTIIPFWHARRKRAGAEHFRPPGNMPEIHDSGRYSHSWERREKCPGAGNFVAA